MSLELDIYCIVELHGRKYSQFNSFILSRSDKNTPITRLVELKLKKIFKLLYRFYYNYYGNL